MTNPRLAAGAGAALFAIAPTVAHAEVFNVPAGKLGEVAVTLGIQSQTTIILARPDLAAVSSPGVRGRLSLRRALTHILRGTGAQAIPLAHGVWQIRRKRSPVRQAPPLPAAVAAPADLPDIVVTASKQDLTIDRYPGSVKIVEPASGWMAGHAAEGTAAITRLLPAISSTNLGNGRNKLFIRGIADSSFSGPTQATTGQFLGDIRLTYNAPDPDLNLYDMKRFEILVGPQGTLYGASSLGGIVRMAPNAPDADAFAATVAAGVGTTQGGGASSDAAAMLNLPLAGGRIATRLVAYASRAGGYIDAPLQRRRNINDMVRYGQRLSLRAEDVGGWTIDAGGVFQNIRSGDGQYVLRGDPPFTRSGIVPQPSENDYRLGYMSFSRSIGNARLVSVSSLAHHHQSSIFDPAGPGATSTPARYREENEATLFYHETRLSGTDGRKPWTAGIAFLSNLNKFTISLSPLDQMNDSAGRREGQTELSLFGQMSRPLTRTLQATLGGRLSSAHASQGLINIPLDIPDDPKRGDLRFSGTVGINWNPGGPLTLFYHYQQGYRPGGLGIFFADGQVRSRRFASDELNVHEIGLRWDESSGRLSGQAALFRGSWKNIQADLIGETGLPSTANIGRGIINGLDVELAWRPVPSLTIAASAFLNDSRLVDPASDFPDAGEQEVGEGPLPNIARGGARIAASLQKPVTPGVTLKLEGSMRYVGRSYLGVGPFLQIRQGDYLVADATARLETARLGISLTIANLANARGNTFSYGNPFGIARRDQITPLRPRSLRLGVDFSF